MLQKNVLGTRISGNPRTKHSSLVVGKNLVVLDWMYDKCIVAARVKKFNISLFLGTFQHFLTPIYSLSMHYAHKTDFKSLGSSKGKKFIFLLNIRG